MIMSQVNGSHVLLDGAGPLRTAYCVSYDILPDGTTSEPYIVPLSLTLRGHECGGTWNLVKTDHPTDLDSPRLQLDEMEWYLASIPHWIREGDGCRFEVRAKLIGVK